MIVLNLQQKAEIIQHAKDSAPNEACGILAGKNNRVEKVYKMINTSDNPKMCYFMDPKEQFKVMKEIRNSGQEMLAIYHSHASSEAYPSVRDVELAYYPEAIYIIVSLQDPKNPNLRAFKIGEGKIQEEEIIDG